MNRTYNCKAYESNCTPVKIIETESYDTLDFLGSIIGKLLSSGVLSAIRTVAALLCFFGFIGIMGSVESETMTVGSGIIVSLFLVFVEILCLIPRRQK